MTKIKKELKSIVSSDESIRNGLPVFKGTRVPVYTIIKHLSLGWSLKDLKEAFPTVETSYIVKLLEFYSQDFKITHDKK